MPSSSSDFANDFSVLPKNGKHDESLSKITEATKCAHCIVKVVSGPCHLGESIAGMVGTYADVGVLMITDNFQIHDAIRAGDSYREDVPFLAYLTEYDEVAELLALRAGFADVLHSGMSMRVLSERIMAAWKRGRVSTDLSDEDHVLGAKPRSHVGIDLINRIFHVGENEIAMSRMEAQLMQVLSSNYHRPVSREELHDAISPGSPYDSRVVDSHIKRLRKKFDAAGISQDFIQTIYGVGYRLSRHI